MRKYELVNFCELDDNAIKSYCAIHNEPERKNLGDITKVDESKLNPFTMICGGSPCQDFSVAGKLKGAKWVCQDCEEEYNPLYVHYTKRNQCPKCGSYNLDKTRSSLLVEWLRIIRGSKPNWGIYENVKNIVGKQFKETFDLFLNELKEYGYNTYWAVLNAKDYGIPQNRERVYLFIVKQELDNNKFKFPTGFDNGIKLKDLLEKEVDEKYYVSSKAISGFATSGNSIVNQTGVNNSTEFRIRKLTPKECYRLMGFSNEDFNKAKGVCSDTQLYKQAGNSIVVDVLYFIYVNIFHAMPYLFEDLRVGSYFSGIGAFEKGLDRLYEDINNGNFT